MFLGVFASASLGMFTHGSSTSTAFGETDSSSAGVAERSFHGWLVIGPRVGYEL